MGRWRLPITQPAWTDRGLGDGFVGFPIPALTTTGDLAFSGNAAFAARIDRFRGAVETILYEGGFVINTNKTRTIPRGIRQRVAGIVVNEHCNIGRTEFDTLKAILRNCTRTGGAGQNRADVPDFRAHLDGRITWAEQINFHRGLKPRRLFDRIDWTTPPSG